MSLSNCEKWHSRECQQCDCCLLSRISQETWGDEGKNVKVAGQDLYSRVITALLVMSWSVAVHDTIRLTRKKNLFRHSNVFQSFVCIKSFLCFAVSWRIGSSSVWSAYMLWHALSHTSALSCLQQHGSAGLIWLRRRIEFVPRCQACHEEMLSQVSP